MELNTVKAIITGGGRGMGAHFAQRLLEAGAQVAVGDVDEGALAALPAGIHTRRLDVSDEADCIAFVEWAHTAMGGLNALVNNAGIIRDGLLVKRDRTTGEIVKLSKAQFDSVIAVNLTGATLMAREFVAKVAVSEARPAVIVNMSSIARHGNRGQTNYVAAKAALAANTLTWAREFAQFGIRVGAVAPGMIETPMTAGMNQKALAACLAAIPLNRMGQPEDIWKAVRFVIECDYFTGRTMDVDGGFAL